ncbi:MAG: PEGA domain-containing protein, partial [Candidatus Zixiibacteriota bacterium]
MKRTLTTLVLTLSLAAATSAQQTAQSGLTVRSNPDGAEVTLKGDAIVTGITPTTFHQFLVGSYTVIVKRHGYENYKTHVMLDPNQPASLDVRLSPRTRIKAAARSLFIPG